VCEVALAAVGGRSEEIDYAILVPMTTRRPGGVYARRAAHGV